MVKLVAVVLRGFRILDAAEHFGVEDAFADVLEGVVLDIDKLCGPLSIFDEHLREAAAVAAFHLADRVVGSHGEQVVPVPADECRVPLKFHVFLLLIRLHHMIEHEDPRCRWPHGLVNEAGNAHGIRLAGEGQLVEVFDHAEQLGFHFAVVGAVAGLELVEVVVKVAYEALDHFFLADGSRKGEDKRGLAVLMEVGFEVFGEPGVGVDAGTEVFVREGIETGVRAALEFFPERHPGIGEQDGVGEDGHVVELLQGVHQLPRALLLQFAVAVGGALDAGESFHRRVQDAEVVVSKERGDCGEAFGCGGRHVLFKVDLEGLAGHFLLRADVGNVGEFLDAVALLFAAFVEPVERFAWFLVDSGEEVGARHWEGVGGEDCLAEPA